METADRFRTDNLDVRHDVLDVIPWETEDDEEVHFSIEDGVLTVGHQGHETCRRGTCERLGEGADIYGRILVDISVG